MDYKRDLAIPISISLKATMIERVTAAAKKRGYPSRSAFVRAVVEKELKQDSQQPSGQKA